MLSSIEMTKGPVNGLFGPHKPGEKTMKNTHGNQDVAARIESIESRIAAIFERLNAAISRSDGAIRIG